MTSEKRDFYGKDVATAIKTACEELQVPQEELDIDVIETGSTGIFGLIRKKAHITAAVKPLNQPVSDDAVEPLIEDDNAIEEVAESMVESADEDEEIEPSTSEEITVEDESIKEEKVEESEELPEEALELIKKELTVLLGHMGYPSPVNIEANGISVLCKVGDEFEEVLTGQEGKTLDSIQYLLRKIIARKVPNRLRLTVDVGNFREKRLENLKVRAKELAEKVKEDGKTQVIPALSPSERRVVHMSLQDDKEIRSRSVGDGLFKKILIYKPGKGNKSGGRRRGNSRGRKGGHYKKKAE